LDYHKIVGNCNDLIICKDSNIDQSKQLGTDNAEIGNNCLIKNIGYIDETNNCFNDPTKNIFKKFACASCLYKGTTECGIPSCGNKKLNIWLLVGGIAIIIFLAILFFF
jgi:hypothetical protein